MYILIKCKSVCISSSCSKEEAQKLIVYSYRHGLSGFAAKLTNYQAKQIEDILFFFLSGLPHILAQIKSIKIITSSKVLKITNFLLVDTCIFFFPELRFELYKILFIRLIRQGVGIFWVFLKMIPIIFSADQIRVME